MRLPDGWSARRDPGHGRPEARIPQDIDDETTRLLMGEAAALLDSMVLMPAAQRFGFPRAWVIMGVGERTDASLERIAEALLVAADRAVPHPPATTNVRRGQADVAGYGSVRIEGEVPLGRQLFGGGWLLRTGLRLAGIDPIRFRIDMFERAKRRYGLGLAAGGRDFRRYLIDLERTRNQASGRLLPDSTSVASVRARVCYARFASPVTKGSSDSACPIS